MIAIIKKNLCRLKGQKASLIVFLCMIIGAISLTLYMDNNAGTLAHIAYVSTENNEKFSSQLQITLVDEKVPISMLVNNRYDAIVTEDLTITTIKNEEFEMLLTQLLEGETIQTPKSNVGETIMKMMTMFIFMQANFLMFALGVDFESQIINRILKSPIKPIVYLLSHILYTMLVSTTLIMIVLTCFNVLGFDIGYTLISYVGLLIMTNAIAASISACFFVGFKKVDTAAMFSQVFTVITSLLSGSFNVMQNSDGVLSRVTAFLPQKLLYDSLSGSFLNFLYVMIWISVAIVISLWIINKQYE